MSSINYPKYIIFSAPSGSGKTTLVQEMMKQGLPLEFSVSATCRSARANEIHGKDYYFITPEEFDIRIAAGEFVEWEEVYKGVKYGTLKAELDRISKNGRIPVFDLDVIGGLNLKKILGKAALAIFMQVSGIEILRKRLINRGTDSIESIEKRIDKAAYEMSFAPQFDVIIINDHLPLAIQNTLETINHFIDE
jgi:guanylate kinase